MPTSPPTSPKGATVTVYFPDPSVVDSVKAAAERLGIPFTVFMRMAVKMRAAEVLRRRPRRAA